MKIGYDNTINKSPGKSISMSPLRSTDDDDPTVLGKKLKKGDNRPTTRVLKDMDYGGDGNVSGWDMAAEAALGVIGGGAVAKGLKKVAPKVVKGLSKLFPKVSKSIKSTLATKRRAGAVENVTPDMIKNSGIYKNPNVISHKTPKNIVDKKVKESKVRKNFTKDWFWDRGATAKPLAGKKAKAVTGEPSYYRKTISNKQPKGWKDDFWSKYNKKNPLTKSSPPPSGSKKEMRDSSMHMRQDMDIK